MTNIFSSVSELLIFTNLFINNFYYAIHTTIKNITFHKQISGSQYLVLFSCHGYKHSKMTQRFFIIIKPLRVLYSSHIFAPSAQWRSFIVTPCIKEFWYRLKRIEHGIPISNHAHRVKYVQEVIGLCHSILGFTLFEFLCKYY